MLENEAMPNPDVFEESMLSKDDEDLLMSNQMFSFSNLQSFKGNFNNEDSFLKNQSRDVIQLPDSYYPLCPISLIFTSLVTYKNFQIMRNQFLLIFKVNYPEDFFKKVYEKIYFTIFGMDKSSKELVSFVVIDIKPEEKTADILALGVVKEYQNKKIATSLLKKALEELTSMGISEVRLIVQQGNENAIRLYQNFGFYIEQNLNEYYNFEAEAENQAYLMKKILISKKFWIFDIFKRITDTIFLKNKNTLRS